MIAWNRFYCFGFGSSNFLTINFATYSSRVEKITMLQRKLNSCRKISAEFLTEMKYSCVPLSSLTSRRYPVNSDGFVVLARIKTWSNSRTTVLVSEGKNYSKGELTFLAAIKEYVHLLAGNFLDLLADVINHLFDFFKLFEIGFIYGFW